MDNGVNGQVFIQKHSGSQHEKDVGSVDGLLQELEDDQNGGCGGVDTGSNQDETKQGTDKGVADNDHGVAEDAPLESSHGLGNLVGRSLRLQGLNEQPSDRDGGVNGTHNGDKRKDASCQSGTTQTLSPLFKLLDLLLVGGFLVRHLNE